jgi:hypothetical protein
VIPQGKECQKLNQFSSPSAVLIECREDFLSESTLCQEIGVGGSLTVPARPRNRTSGSAPRRVGWGVCGLRQAEPALRIVAAHFLQPLQGFLFIQELDGVILLYDN